MFKNVLLLAAVALLVPQLAIAGSVTYSTKGTFFSSGGMTSANMPVTFNNVTNVTVTTPGTGVLGTFTLGTFAKCKHSSCIKQDDLTLTILQSGGGSGNLSATVTGVVFFNKTTGNITWAFDPLKTIVTINGVTYVGLSGSSVVSNQVLALISGTPSVPEPKAELLLGLGSMGLMGLALVSRKRINI